MVAALLSDKQNMQAIILAAGNSRRFNGIKQLAPLGEQALIDLALLSYLNTRPKLKRVSLVLGANADVIQNHVLERFKDHINIVVVDDWHQGVGHSIRQAIANVGANISHVLIGLADQVSVTNGGLNQLVEVSRQYPEKIVASGYQSTLGAPVVFPRSYFVHLGSLSGDQGAKSLLQEYADNLVRVDMPSAAVDIDTREDLQNWLAAGRP